MGDWGIQELGIDNAFVGVGVGIGIGIGIEREHYAFLTTENMGICNCLF